MPVAVIGAHVSVAPGFWLSMECMGSTSPSGVVTMIAHGVEGVPLDYRAESGRDHCRRGVDAEAWATLALHEAAHAAHLLMVGFGAASAAVRVKRDPGMEIEGFAAFAGLVHERLTGHRLPPDYAASRWPQDAPGMGGWVGKIAEAVAPFAVAPAGERPCDDAAWAALVHASVNQDMRDCEAQMKAAAAWRAAFAGDVL
jgi:hypothetical protein